MTDTNNAAQTNAPTNAQSGEMIFSMTPELVSNAIKASGCAVTEVEENGVTQLYSASHGIGFQVLWGNVVSPGNFADLTLSCPLRVQGGTLPVDVLTDWHRTKRFARVAQHGDFVVLEMDVLAAGGVSPAHVAVSLQLWTQMMGQFFLHLRNFKPSAPAAAGADAAETSIAVPAGEVAV